MMYLTGTRGTQKGEKNTRNLNYWGEIKRLSFLHKPEICGMNWREIIYTKTKLTLNQAR